MNAVSTSVSSPSVTSASKRSAQETYAGRRANLPVVYPAARTERQERVEALVAEEHVELLPAVEMPDGASGKPGDVLEPRGLGL